MEYNASECWNTEGLQKASQKLVYSALEFEAKKRGFKEGIYFKNIFNTTTILQTFGGFNMSLARDLFYMGDYPIFNNGKWAEIVETLSIKEAEEKFNCKII